MNKRNVFIFFLIISGLLLIVSCAPSVPTSQYGIINVNSTPDGAKIYLDGVDTGMATPFTITNLEPGSYTIKLDNSCYKIWEESVIVTAGETTYLNPILRGADQEFVVIQPGSEGKDAFVASDFSDQNYGNCLYSIIGGSTSSFISRYYLQFDLSGIPSNARVLSADLELYQFTLLLLEPGTFDINIHKVTSNWEEDTITWNLQPTCAVDVEYTNDITDGETGGRYWNLDDIVQGWVDGTIVNYGIVLKDSDEDEVRTYATFRTSDYNTETIRRPRLEIGYYIP
jgi:hypothetical protein